MTAQASPIKMRTDIIDPRPRCIALSLTLRFGLLLAIALSVSPVAAVALAPLVLLTNWPTLPNFAEILVVTAAHLTAIVDALNHLKENLEPVGAISLCFEDSAPTGSLFLQGQAVSRTAYAALYALWGTTYGAGDGTTTFNLPDYRNRFAYGASGTVAVGTTGGAATVTLSVANLPAHVHSVPAHLHLAYYIATLLAAGGNSVPSLNTSGGGAFSVATDSGTGGDTGSTGSGTSFSILPPYLAVNYMVRAL